MLFSSSLTNLKEITKQRNKLIVENQSDGKKKSVDEQMVIDFIGN
jgi:hypothetical protein